MMKSAAISVRIPVGLKQRLVVRAKAEHRSLSAQIAYDLEAAARTDPGKVRGGKILGLFATSRVPTDEDVAAARALLWGRLQKRG